ncbi:alpha/beta hydrolase [Aquamicrobium zhengzhouense]|uniref:Alpha/beta hydrolase n=1 Tax=Aquamicrobium zhengzhouense TaxID=2781738 RepID=A0ABS0S8P5_9HYPH|nr:alpha/beta hydrolase [Aquamicrobium zhengzhouense]MBI1619591.1 alpha/beta hydrolase [Aquamicrobium zhengzhouense]
MKGQDPYLIRDFVDDFDAIAAEFTARSRGLSARTIMRTDVAYGDRPRETLDLLFPDNVANGAPLHVFVHGGYWRSGDKADYRFVAETPLSVGAIVALVEYDLMPGQRLPVLIDQVRRAVLWLQDNAASFGADPTRLTVSGHSAGAHLTSFLAARGAEEAAPTLPSVKGLLLLSGIYDLSGIPDSFLRAEAQMTHQEAAGWSPLLCEQLSGPNRVIAYGGDETRPFVEQASAFEQKLHANGQHAELLRMPETNHMNVVLALADGDSLLGRSLLDLVNIR